MRLKIVSDETANVITGNGTQFFLDGKEVEDIAAADISYRPGAIVTATLRVLVNPGTIEANPLLSMESLKEAAGFYGLKLVEK